MALAAISLFSFNGMAQSPANGNSTPAGKKEKPMKVARMKERVKVNLFEGMTLSENQKAQLQQLDEKMREDRRQNDQIRKEEKQRNDSLRIAKRRSAQKEYLEQVKSIVGPDQYVTFLENAFINGGAQKREIFTMDRRPRPEFHQGRDGKHLLKEGKKEGMKQGSKQKKSKRDRD